ncbi:hypothetical protein RIR_jg24228.t1 [Rhizophagus irregularis DAOM 181602=DAOM 197198]|uniref:Uncharacterized protein n=1 Tax=Rhizophagus irregularis (strain DAOM 181602 / DAOM 197198 / MUCL 43194) TaxID=747089 RepID=U9UZN0_RHIID|nr:hypothetical protein RIR_jg24228.t1 [Rhizophagus irregularis DAOM 181602=DAOM 197198]
MPVITPLVPLHMRYSSLEAPEFIKSDACDSRKLLGGTGSMLQIDVLICWAVSFNSDDVSGVKERVFRGLKREF